MDRFAVLDAAAIAALVDRFYERVRRDPALGPVFEAAVHDWDEHTRTLVSFWSSVALGERTYRGNPMGVHRAVGGIDAVHFERWLALWRDTAGEVLEPAAAATMIDYADRIGASLQLGLGLAGTRAPVPGLRILG